MRHSVKLFVLFVLLSSTGYPQYNPIDSYVKTAWDLDHTYCVNSIRVKSFHYYEMEQKIDTLYSEYLALYKNEELIKRSSFSKNDPSPTQEIFYDALGRIDSLTRKDYEGKYFQIIQYFSNKSTYPDSTNFYFNHIKNESYINTFEDTLVVKQEHFYQDTLKNYSTFKYNGANRLLERINVNTKNGYGITLSRNITGTEDKKTLYPNDTINFQYSNVADTLIRKKYTQKELEEIHKSVTRDGVITEICEDADTYSTSENIRRIYQDSTSLFIYRMNEKGDTTSVLKEHRDFNKIRSQWIQDGGISESLTVITREYDSLENWIKKIEIRNGVLEDTVLREIKYCQQKSSTQSN